MSRRAIERYEFKPSLSMYIRLGPSPPAVLRLSPSRMSDDAKRFSGLNFKLQLHVGLCSIV